MKSKRKKENVPNLKTVTRPMGIFWSLRRGHTDVLEYEKSIKITLNVVLRRTVDNRDRAHSHRDTGHF